MPVLKVTPYRWVHYLGWLSKPLSFIILVLLVPGMMPFQRTELSKEYQVKAVFLFNFTQFVEWPATAFTEPETPFVIGILGKDPFGNFLDQTISGEKVSGRPIVVQRFQTLEEIKTCHILFINVTDNRFKPTITSLKNKNILTVGDANGFTKQGGMIRFITEENKIRIRINLEASEAADLTISSKLLRLAEIVSTQKN